MKTQNRIRAAGLLLLGLLFQTSFATSIGGSIMGQVTDPDTKQPVSDATVVFDNQGSQKIFFTNEHGFYYASNIPAGMYSITVSYSSNHVNIPDFKIGNDEERTQDFSLPIAHVIEGVTIITKRGDPVIDPVDPVKEILKRPEIKHMPIIGISGLTETSSGVVSTGGEFYVHGARAGGLSYYIDGCRIMGTPDIPLCGLDNYRMYSGFIPPKYGDATGGVVVMETRNFFSEH